MHHASVILVPARIVENYGGQVWQVRVRLYQQMTRL